MLPLLLHDALLPDRQQLLTLTFHVVCVSVCVFGYLTRCVIKYPHTGRKHQSDVVDVRMCSNGALSRRNKKRKQRPHVIGVYKMHDAVKCVCK